MDVEMTVTVDPRLSEVVIVTPPDWVGVDVGGVVVGGVVVDVVDVEEGGVEEEVGGVELGGVDEGVVMIEELVENVEEVDSEVGTEVGLLLALVLDDDGTEELELGVGAWVDDDGTPVSVLVELDIVNCLTTRFLGCLYIAMSAKKTLMVRVHGSCYG